MFFYLSCLFFLLKLSTVHEVDINKNRKDIEEALERIREHSVFFILYITY